MVGRWPGAEFSAWRAGSRIGGAGAVGGGFEMSIVAYLRALTELGPKYVAVTDGARGAFVASHKEIIFSPALEFEDRRHCLRR